MGTGIDETDGTGKAVQSDWGRVTDDGTVYVRTADGERVVGSWQAGPPAEGLAHYSRRYDDLVTEVTLLGQRIESGAADPKATLATIRRLRESLPTAPVVGDLEGVATQLDTVQAKAEDRLEQAKAQRAIQLQEALARKRALVEEVEALAASSTHWKVAGERLREVIADWKDGPRVDRKDEAEMWKRLNAARAAFTRRRGAHFAQLDVTRKEAQARKEALVAEAEGLSESSEWGPAARQLKDLMTQWKAAPRASREAEEDLWMRFRAAQDTFFGRRSEALAERDAASRGNRDVKEKLIVAAEQLDLADPRAAQERLRDLQERYEKGGRVPREEAAALDDRMRDAEDRVRDAVDDRWRRTAATSNPLLDQMREQVTKAEKRVARARAAGDERALAEAESSLARRREFLEQAERSAR
ncbi:MAG: DUF349 domain-containing protein [Actinomycetota bacterium]|nr:DUF349 domain-containing protein [Actinomycetota bacterium]